MEIDSGNIMDNAAEAIKEVLLELNRPSTSKEIKKLVSEKYPNKFQDSTIDAHLYGCSANNPKAYEHHASQPKILWDRQDGTYELYDAKKHGTVCQDYQAIRPKNHKDPIIDEEQPFIVIDNEKYVLSNPVDEAQLEKMVKEHSKLIFGDDSLYFNIKKQITTKTDVGSKPDGYAISLNSKRWYVVEVELASHDPYKHILPQITKFLNGIDNHDNQKAITGWIYSKIQENPAEKALVDKITNGESHYFLTNLIGQQPIVMILVDEKTTRLEEACKRLNPKPDIVEFKTFLKVDNTKHAHLVCKPLDLPDKIFEPTNASEPVNPDSKELEELRQVMSKLSTILKKNQRKLELLPIGEDIVNLQVTNELLDKIYIQAQKEAKEKGYHDAELSSFIILVYPFSEDSKVTIFFDFYSKLANKVYSFMFRDADGVLEHTRPDKVSPSYTIPKLLGELPWKMSPKWLIALRKGYLRIGQFSPNNKTAEYNVIVSSHDESPISWRFSFADNCSGITNTYRWSGNENDEPYKVE